MESGEFSETELYDRPLRLARRIERLQSRNEPDTEPLSLEEERELGDLMWELHMADDLNDSDA